MGCHRKCDRAAEAWFVELAAEYDVRRGRLWPFVLLVVVVGPEAARLTSR